MAEEAFQPGASPAEGLGRCPRRKALQEHALWDEMLLYAPGQELAFSLNAPAKAIWELCDGRHSLAAICEELGRRFHCPAATLQADVHKAVARLQQLGLVEWDEPLPPPPNG